MTELLEYYHNQIHNNPAANSLLADFQRKGAAALKQFGFPTKKDEAWKYTSVDAWQQSRYTEATQTGIAPELPRGLEQARFFTMVNGLLQMDRGATHNTVVIKPLAQALEEKCRWVTEHLDKLLQIRHGFQALNTAMLSKGMAIYIPDNVQLDIPLYLMHWQDTHYHSVHLRNVLVLGKNASVTFVEDYHGAANVNYFTNTITEAYLAEGARLEHYKIQRESKCATHIGHLHVKQMKSSRLSHHAIHCGGSLVRSDVSVEFSEENAECFLNGVYAPGNNQHVDQHIECKHLVPNCSSEQNYKGVLQGKSRAVFNGTVYVEKNAQHTFSQQQNKNLLLSTDAEIDTKPQLEIFADDVICAHGATVGQLDEDALFYLKTRGIDGSLARQLLIDAFAIENFNRMPNKELSQWVKQLFNDQMEPEQ